MLFVLNSLIVPINFQKHPQAFIKLKTITIEEAKILVKTTSSLAFPPFSPSLSG